MGNMKKINQKINGIKKELENLDEIGFGFLFENQKEIYVDIQDRMISACEEKIQLLEGLNKKKMKIESNKISTLREYFDMLHEKSDFDSSNVDEKRLRKYLRYRTEYKVDKEFKLIVRKEIDSYIKQKKGREGWAEYKCRGCGLGFDSGEHILIEQQPLYFEENRNWHEKCYEERYDQNSNEIKSTEVPLEIKGSDLSTTYAIKSDKLSEAEVEYIKEQDSYSI